jgi:hypothetical protein
VASNLSQKERGWRAVKKLRAKDYIRFALVITLVLAVLVGEMLAGSLRTFYTDHPLQAGVLTGVLLSIVAYFGFDAVRAELTEQRWRPLSKVALLALKYETTVFFDTLLWLVTARPPVNHARPAATSQRKLTDLRAAVGLSPPTDLNLATIKRNDYESMLRLLIEYPPWRAFAVKFINRAKWRHRDGIAAWAAPMLSTGESADVLNRVAILNEWSSEFDSGLLSLEPGEVDLEQVVDDWLNWLSEAVSLREDLVRASRGRVSSADQESRRLLTPADVLQLEERDRGHDTARRTLTRPFKPSPVG